MLRLDAQFEKTKEQWGKGKRKGKGKTYSVMYDQDDWPSLSNDIWDDYSEASGSDGAASTFGTDSQASTNHAGSRVANSLPMMSSRQHKKVMSKATNTQHIQDINGEWQGGRRGG